MIKINKEELKELLLHVRGTTAVSFISRTEKKLPGVGDVIKAANVSGLLGTSYTSSMNRSLAKDGFEADFQAQPRKWGTRISGTPLIEHKGKTYVETKVQHVHMCYMSLTGELLDVKETEPDSRIVLRDYNLENIKSLNIQGKKYEIV